MLSFSQFGFRPHNSTFMPVLNLVDKITLNFENNKHSVGIFLDLTKAFDVIDHNILLKKLKYYGFRGLSYIWLTNYLTNRKQYTEVNNIRSEFRTIKTGVPQGSILGPLLFLLFINDLPNISNLVEFLLFADDTNIIASHDNFQDLIHLINIELSNIAEWFKLNKLVVNISKTNCIYFHPKRKKTPNNILDIKMDNINITQTSSTKFLGIIVDQHLSWKENTDNLAKKISKNLNIIKHIKKFLNPQALHKLYYTLIHPHLIYCNIVWGNNYKIITEKIQILQNKSIRLIFKERNYISTTNLMTKFKILNISNIHKYQTGIFIFKYLHKLLPPFFYSKLFQDKYKITYVIRTRNINNLSIPFASTTTRLFTIKFSGPRIWNNLPSRLKNINSISSFKNAIKNYFIINQI